MHPRPATAVDDDGAAGRVLPFDPPLQPMLASLARTLPAGDFFYEPKWDGFRCMVFSSQAGVDLRSRHGRPLTRYFPELEQAFRAVAVPFVADGEIVLRTGRPDDFATLLARLHPAASRVERLARETPSEFVAFDLLALGAEDLRRLPFAERRAALEQQLAGAPPPLHVTPATRSAAAAARWLDGPTGPGIDGVVAKHADLTYQPGRRAMVKVKREHTADCVVAGFRLLEDVPLLSSLLLGLHDAAGVLRHVGVVASFRREQRSALLEDLGPHVVPLGEHPWREGFLLGPSPTGRLKGAAGRWTPDLELDWVPVAPRLVCEVAYDQVDRDRFRHPARFRRWRPDRDPGSCTFDQLVHAAPGGLS